MSTPVKFECTQLAKGFEISYLTRFEKEKRKCAYPIVELNEVALAPSIEKSLCFFECEFFDERLLVLGAIARFGFAVFGVLGLAVIRLIAVLLMLRVLRLRLVASLHVIAAATRLRRSLELFAAIRSIARLMRVTILAGVMRAIDDFEV